MHYLYKITNVLDNKIYIGQTKGAEARWRAHKYIALHPEKKLSRQYVHHAISKHGIDNFIYEVIATCRTQEDANMTEELLIVQYDSQNSERGYNIKHGGNTSSPSEKTKLKMSIAAKARIIRYPNTIPSHDTPHSEETKKKIREKRAIQITTAETREKMSKSRIGHGVSGETRLKISSAQKGTKRPNQTGEKHHNYGKPLTDEVKKKKSEAMKGKTWKIVDGKRVWSSI